MGRMTKRQMYAAGLCVQCASFWERRAVGRSMGWSCGGVFLFERSRRPDQPCDADPDRMREAAKQAAGFSHNK